MLKEFFSIPSYYFNPYSVPVILVSLLIFSIGIFVFKQNRRSVVNAAFFTLDLTIALWLFTISFVYSVKDPKLSLFLYKYFTFLGVVNIMPSLIFFSIAWIGQVHRKKQLIIANYVISFIFYILGLSTDKVIAQDTMRQYFWGFYPVYGHWAAFYILFFLVQFIISSRNLLTAYRNEKNPIKRSQIRTITTGVLIAFTASFDFAPKFFQFEFYPYGYISMFIYISMLAYAIVRYRAFDIEAIIHKTALWLLTSLSITIPIFALYCVIFKYLKNSLALQTGFWAVGFIVISLYFRFVQRRQSKLEDISLRFTEELVHLKGLNQLIRHIEEALRNSLNPRSINIFLYNSEDKKYALANQKEGDNPLKEMPSENNFLGLLAKTNKIVYREFVDIDPNYDTIKNEANNYFQQTEAIVVIPLVINDNLLGVVNLGMKNDLKRYSGQDFQFLTTLKNQSTIAVSNSLLYENIEGQVRQRTKELVDLQKQLVQAEKMATVGTLAGGVAHEINNPLTAVLANVQMLITLGTDDKEFCKESLELIEEATKRCKTIVQKLMTYAKKPSESLSLSRFDLSDALKTVSAFLGYQLQQDNVEIVIDTDKADYFILGNRNELEQVLTNIIVNARDAIKQVKKSGSIRISFSKKDSWIYIDIKDEGSGIPKEIISKIFDPFFTTKEIGKGLGLGLSICQNIVERHNGFIKINSEIMVGTTVTLKLPEAADLTTAIDGKN